MSPLSWLRRALKRPKRRRQDQGFGSGIGGLAFLGSGVPAAGLEFFGSVRELGGITMGRQPSPSLGELAFPGFSPAGCPGLSMLGLAGTPPTPPFSGPNLPGVFPEA